MRLAGQEAQAGKAGAGSGQAPRGGLWPQSQAEWTPLPSFRTQAPWRGKPGRSPARPVPSWTKPPRTLKPCRVLAHFHAAGQARSFPWLQENPFHTLKSWPCRKLLMPQMALLEAAKWTPRPDARVQVPPRPPLTPAAVASPTQALRLSAGAAGRTGLGPEPHLLQEAALRSRCVRSACTARRETWGTSLPSGGTGPSGSTFSPFALLGRQFPDTFHKALK